MTQDSDFSYTIVESAGSVTTTRNTADLGTAILAAPGSGRAYRIKELHLQALAAGPVTATLKTAAGETIRLFRLSGDGASFHVRYGALEAFVVAENKPIYLELGAAVAVEIFIDYFITVL